MTSADLHTKIRELIAAGVLPEDPPAIERSAPTTIPEIKRSRILVGGSLHEPCTICDEPGPQVQYFYLAGHVVSVHAACDAIWQQEKR